MELQTVVVLTIIVSFWYGVCLSQRASMKHAYGEPMAINASLIHDLARRLHERKIRDRAFVIFTHAKLPSIINRGQYESTIEYARLQRVVPGGVTQEEYNAIWAMYADVLKSVPQVGADEKMLAVYLGRA